MPSDALSSSGSGDIEIFTTSTSTKNQYASSSFTGFEMDAYTCSNTHSAYLVTHIHNFQASMSDGENSATWQCTVTDTKKTYAIKSGVTEEYMQLSSVYTYGSIYNVYPLYLYIITTSNSVKIKCTFENPKSGYTYTFACGVQVVAI